MSMPSDLASLLAHPLPNAQKVVVTTHIRRSFRPVFVLEILAFGLLLICLLPLLFLAGILMLGALFEGGGGGGDLRVHSKKGAPPRSGLVPGQTVRAAQDGFFQHRLAFEVEVLDGEGGAILRREVPLHSAAESDALLASVLQAADRHGLYVEERISASEDPVGGWLGGLPLLAPPSRENTQWWSKNLPTHLQATRTDRQWLLTYQELPVNKGAVVLWLRALVASLLLPFTLFTKPAPLSEVGRMWAEALRLPLPCHTLEIRPDGLRFVTRRGQTVMRDVHIDGYALVGVGASERLVGGRQITHHGPQIRILGQRDTLYLPVSFSGTRLHLVASFVRCAVVELQKAWPEAAPHHGVRPIRCPYCSETYTFAPGAGCPSCGGWPKTVAR